MNRNEIAALAADRLQITLDSADNAVKQTFSAITEGLARTGSVSIAHFGSFTVRERKGRRCRVPSTGEIIQTADKKTVRFKPSRRMLDELK